MEQDFFIKKGYQTNKLVRIPSVEIADDIVYWTPTRMHAASYYQYDVYTYALRFIQSKKIQSMIDVGCGPGKKLQMIHQAVPELEIGGVDQAEAITYCKKTYDFGQWQVEDFEKPQTWSDNKTDLVICADVIEHLVNPDLVLDNIKNKLNPDGYLIISTPERDKIVGKKVNIPSNVDHIREWNQTEFAAYLESRGFEILEHKLQYPAKKSINRYFFKMLVKQLLRFQSLKYNQICLAKWKG